MNLDSFIKKNTCFFPFSCHLVGLAAPVLSMRELMLHGSAAAAQRGERRHRCGELRTAGCHVLAQAKELN